MVVNDQFSRPLRDLRISVTDKCNFRCNYCMPEDVYGFRYEFLPKDKILTFEEITRLTRLFVQLGVSKIRLTGGEPMLRQELEKLIAQIAQIAGVKDIALTTNGYFLKEKAETLKRAGLHRLSISLDTLDPDRFKKLAGRHLELEKTLAGIHAANAVGFAPIKINSVIQRGVNDDEIVKLVGFARSHGAIIRFIEFMDVGNLNGWKMDSVVTAAEIVDIVSQEYRLMPAERNYASEVANRYLFADGCGEMGIIASVSQPFCGDCTRARVSADGQIFTCLFSGKGFDIKSSLRSGASDESILAQVTNLWQKREDRYSEARSTEGTGRKQKVEMYQIGG